MAERKEKKRKEERGWEGLFLFSLFSLLFALLLTGCAALPLDPTISATATRGLTAESPAPARLTPWPAETTAPAITPTPAAAPSPVGRTPAPEAGATPTPGGPDVVVDESQWHVLYRRPGWAGGPALDLRAVGDIMLGRGIEQAAGRRGYDYPLRLALPLLSGDLSVGNLESPLTSRREGLRPGPYRLPAPPAFADQLSGAGLDVLSLANNHALDAGPAGLEEAVATLKMAGVTPLGAGPSAGEARAPAILRAAGLDVALLGFNDVRDPEDQPDEALGWGRAWLGEDALAAVRQARESSDVVVVVVHWGNEYETDPAPRQREWARKLVAAGADLVVGAHPHVLQPVEVLDLPAARRPGLIAYSLGNFLFDQEYEQETSLGAVLRVLIDEQGIALAAAAPVVTRRAQVGPLELESEGGALVVRRLTGAGPAGQLQGWRWDGSSGQALELPPDTRFPARPQRLPADLRGDDRPLWATLDGQGLLEVRDGAEPDSPLVWRNEAPDWHVTRFDVGDPNDDGRIELALLLWKPAQQAEGAQAELASHPFLMGWRGGRYRIIWGGSATRVPIQDLATGDLDGDGRSELVVLEGGQAPGDPGEALAVWSWHGWGFELAWRSAPGRWRELALQDVDGDGLPEIIASS